MDIQKAIVEISKYEVLRVTVESADICSYFEIKNATIDDVINGVFIESEDGSSHIFINKCAETNYYEEEGSYEFKIGDAVISISV